MVSHRRIRLRENIYTSMWHVVYKNRSCKIAELVSELEAAGIVHFVPEQAVERYDAAAGEMLPTTTIAINNIVFIDTHHDINAVVHSVGALQAPMIDPLTGLPATVPDNEMLAFKLALQSRPTDVKLLCDPYSRFEDRPLVRVKAGLFQGLTGRVVRIRRDRKLVVSLGAMAVAVSGISRSLLEQI